MFPPLSIMKTEVLGDMYYSAPIKLSRGKNLFFPLRMIPAVGSLQKHGEDSTIIPSYYYYYLFIFNDKINELLLLDSTLSNRFRSGRKDGSSISCPQGCRICCDGKRGKSEG
jgi:hypothetical protein